jgi:hypothetical protein
MGMAARQYRDTRTSAAQSGKSEDKNPVASLFMHIQYVFVKYKGNSWISGDRQRFRVKFADEKRTINRENSK